MLRLRPAGSSLFWIALRIAQLRGDPHITTIDGLTYTFNGRGEYTLIKSEPFGFEVQGRTGGVGDPIGATVFTGFAGKLKANGTLAQVSFNTDLDAVELWINGTLMENHDWNNRTTFGNLDVYNETSSSNYVIAFENGVIIKVSADFTLKMMTVSVIMATEMRNNVTGLMGNYNDDSSDDLFNTNGDTIAHNSTEEDIFPIAKTWLVLEEDTMFTYPDGSNYSVYNYPDFTPSFFNADLSVMFSDSDKRLEATKLCNDGADTDTDPTARRECYFDFMITDNADVAKATVQTSKDLGEEQSAFSNYAPAIHSPSNQTLQVTVGQTYISLFTINATDSNGDDITFTKSSGPDEVAVGAADGVISWSNVVYSENGSLVFAVSDGKVSSEYSPQVAICNCMNGGSCLWDIESSFSWYTVPCQCTTGWTGAFCDEDLDGCADKPCFTACTDVPASQVATQGSEFLCDPCPSGLGGDGTTCYDIDECLVDQPCQHDCENTAGSYICSCNAGYALAGDAKTCVDIDECMIRADNCDSRASCSNTDGSYTCTCSDGYQGDGMNGNCQNIDECSTGTATCPDNSNCADTVGSYACNCEYGFKKDGSSCVEIDECSLGNLCGQKCVDAIGSYTCACDDNFSLNATDLVTCHPDRTCTGSEAAGCDGGNARSTCAKDTAGEVLCYCPQGYALDSSSNCQDINECSTGASICSAATSTCNNTAPGYTCDCKAGFERSFDGVTCDDVDECATDADNCAQTCTNTAGSFVCGCASGYTLAANGYGCEDVNECVSALTNNCDGKQGVCSNQDSSDVYYLGYTCGCTTGYELSADGFTCNDLNECNADGRGGCVQGCSNNIGSFSCFCGNGYVLNDDKLSCDNVNECASDNLNNCYDSKYCTDTEGGYTCACPTGFRLKSDGFTCESVLKCGTNNCTYSCSVVNETDTCQCARGYALGNDSISCVDMDECALGTDNCDSSNNVKCVNDKPGFHCDCVSDFYNKVEDAKCIDVDECAVGTAECSPNSYCDNKLDGYDCVCSAGYGKTGADCFDINECVVGLTICHDTLSTCTNEEGTYSCACIEGYDGDGIRCADVNECVGENTCEENPEKGFCINTVGGYDCGCYDGFQKMASNACQDINECNNKALYKVNCSQLCDNTDGSFACGCQNGYRVDVDGFTCVPMVECDANSGCQDGCLKKNGQDTCTCNPGYNLAADNKTCTDVDECAEGTSSCDAVQGICGNTEGSFTCACNNSYILGPNNECEDRDGGVGEWGAWGNCSAECGNNGKQVRSRACNNPTKEGDGIDCAGDLTEEAECNVLLCKEDLDFGAKFDITGITAVQFSGALDVFHEKAAGSINRYCTNNTNFAQDCCGTNTTFERIIESPAGKVFTTAVQLSSWFDDMAGELGVTVILTVQYDENNDVCSATGPQSRRKRAATAFISQDALVTLFYDPVVLSQIASAVATQIKASTGEDVTVNIKLPEYPEQITTAVPTTTVTTTAAATATTTTSSGGKTTVAVPASQGLESWVIAVAVVASLVAVAVIIIIIVVLIKRPRKVGSSDLPNDNDNNATNNHTDA